MKAVKSEPVKFWFESGNFQGWVQAQKINEQLWIHCDGQIFVEDLQTSSGRRGRVIKSKSDGDLQSPMPGKITKILKNSEDSVEVGDVVVVMEAMKMEYTLKAEIKGRVKEINVKVGEQVELGKILVRIGSEA